MPDDDLGECIAAGDHDVDWTEHDDGTAQGVCRHCGAEFWDED